MLFNVFLKLVTEFLDVLPFHIQGGSVRVSSETGHQVAATLDGFVDIEAGDASGRADSKFTFFCRVFRDDNRRSGIDLRKAGGDNADDAFFPLLGFSIILNK